MTPLDLAIVGGGITGLGVARLAARHGLTVALFERGDFAAATSSASSHMLHGGLRYLEHGHFALVREALAERAALLRMAPALARPCRFLVPLYAGARVGRWRLRAGLALYDVLAGARGLAPHGRARARETLALEPGLAPDGLRGAGFYTDVVMDDARLAIAVARDAADHGAALHSYTEVVGLHPAPGGGVELAARDTLTGATLAVTARVVVNAAGPWCDAVRRLARRGLAPGAPDPAPLLRPSRGIHLVYPALTAGHAVLTFARADGRAIFAIPFAGRTLVGTTEAEVASPPTPEDLRPTAAEVRYLRAELARLFPAARGMEPLAVFAGVRPLLASGDEVGRAPREHRVVTEGALVTVCGGKWTTFRLMARDALAAALARCGRTLAPRDADDPLPAPPPEASDPAAIAADAVERQFARRVGDVLRRRSTLWLADDRGRGAAPRVAAAMAGPLGWSAQRVRDELEVCEAALREEAALLAAAREDA